MDNRVKNMIAEWDKKWDEVMQQDKLAKKNKTLIGRYYKESRGDGFAIYRIVADNGKRCKVERVTGIGDDWTIRRFEMNPWVSRWEIKDNVEHRDVMTNLFGNRNV